MIKKLTFSFLLLTSTLSFSQQSITFKNEFQPNKTYTTKTVTTTYSEVEIIADEELKEQLKNNGFSTPMVTEGEINTTIIIKTHQRKLNGDIEATLEYDEMSSTNTINGETKTENLPFVGMKIKGKYDRDSKLYIDSIIGDNVTEEMKSILLTTIESMQQSIDFPDKEMKVGDTFNSDIPMSIPMPGMNPIEIVIKTDYLLTKIKKGKAYFDFDQSIELGMDIEEMNFSASGSGVGNAIFDIKESSLTDYFSEIPMKMIMEINEDMTLELIMNVTTNQTIKIK